MTINAVMLHSQWQECCKIIYLHVAAYNSVALKFYESNGFKHCCILKEWYEIFERPYDAILLYKPLEA